MAYGDSCAWDGNVPMESEFTIKWKTTFRIKGEEVERSCEFSVVTGDELEDVARKLAAAWEKQVREPSVEYEDTANKKHKVSFDGEVVEDGMWVMGHRVDKDPPPEYSLVEYGEKIEVLKGLWVFNA